VPCPFAGRTKRPACFFVGLTKKFVGETSKFVIETRKFVGETSEFVIETFGFVGVIFMKPDDFHLQTPGAERVRRDKHKNKVGR